MSMAKFLRHSICFISIALLWMGCGSEARQSNNAEQEAWEPIFNPALLLPAHVTAEFTVHIPPVEASLEGPVRYQGIVGIVVECADAKTQALLEKQLSEAQDTIRILLSQQRVAAIRTTSGQMRLREDILASLKRLLKTDDLKEVYFHRLTITPTQG